MDVRETIHTFEKGRWRDVPYTGGRIVEIVPVAPLAAYFRAGLDYDNGHSCSIEGVAKAEGAALVYRNVNDALGHCVLTIRRMGNSLRLDDGDESCKAYCGARGTLSNVRIPYASKRSIRYLGRLERSGEYQSAIKEWRTGKPAE